MYWKLRLPVITLLLLFVVASPSWAGLAEDQYAIAAHHYASARWAMAVEEFEQFLADYAQHEQADAVVFYLAESLVQLKQFQDAHNRYEEYLRRAPTGKYARQSEFRLGETLYLNNQNQEARPYLAKFVEQHPDDALSAYAFPYLGEVALSEGDPQAAQKAFELGLQKFPEGPLVQECRFGLARVLEDLGDAEGAIRFYDFLGGADQRSGISDDALMQMAILLYKSRRFSEAVVALQRHRDRFPGSELSAHAAYWLGLSQTSLGQFQQAATTLLEGADRYREHELAPAMLFAAGEAQRRLDKLAQAQRAYAQLLDQYPSSDWADDSLQVLIRMAWDAGEYERVRELAQTFMDQHAESRLLANVQQTAARVYLKQGEFDRAIELLEPCLKAVLNDDVTEEDDVAVAPDEAPLPSLLNEPSNAAANLAATRYYLALALLGAERHEEALQQLDALQDVREPKELVAGVHAARASAHLGLEQYELAIQSLHLYLTTQPQGPDAEKCRAQLAVTCARLGRWSEVQRVFAQMQQSEHDQQLYLSSLEYMAEAAYSGGQRELAAEMFRELARDGNPDKYVIQGMSGLAWLDWTGGQDAANSARKFDQLLKRFPDSPIAAEAAMMRGQSLEQADRLAGAAAMYQLVLDRYSDSRHVSSAMLAAARIYDTLQRDREAEPLLRQWLADYPNSPQRPDALYQLAWVLVDMGDEQAADEVFQQIHDECQDSRYWSDATYRLAERAARANQFDRADALSREIVSQATQPQMVAYALYLRGQLAAAQKRWLEVEEPLQRLLADHPDSPHRVPAEYWLAEAYFRQRRYDEAGELFARLEQATRQQTDAWVAMIPLRYAQILAHNKKWIEAHEIAASVTKRFPQFSQQHEVDYLTGRYHASRAEFEQARQAYERVIRSATGRGTETAAVAQWMIGETYFMQDQYNWAIKAYHRVEGLYDYPRWTAAALLQAGKCHEMVGRWKEASDLYSRVVEEFSETPVAQKAARRLRVAQQRATLMNAR
jgi:TolA-binding protein